MLRSAVLVLCFTLFVLPLFLPLTKGDDGETIVIGAEADTMIKSLFPNNNYGTITWQLEVQNQTVIPEFTEKLAIFRFNLSTVSTDFVVTSAVLSLRVVSWSIDYPHVMVGSHYYSGSWNETELTWNNFDFSSLNTEPTDVVDIYLGGVFNWTITTDVTAALNGTKILSEVMMVIYPYGEGYTDHTTFASREAGAPDYRPKLIIEGFMPDVTPPIISILFPENKTYPVDEVPLTFTMSETTSWIGYSLDSQANTTITGNTTLTGLSEGTHGLIVYAIDVAGNTGSSDMVYFTIDTTPPSISIVSPENKTYDTTDIPLTFAVDESVSWMGYSLDSQANVTITGNRTLTGLSEGTHSIVVYVTDTAGNTGASETIHFSIETTQPEPPQPEPPPSEAFPTWIVAAIVIITVIGVAILIYFTKVR